MNAPVKLSHVARLADLTDGTTVLRIEEFVRDQKASVFHRPAWLNAVQASTGQRAAGIIAEQLGVITGWLPLTEVRSLLFPNTLVSSGFGVGGGICAESGDAARTLANAAQNHAVDMDFSSIEVRGGFIPDDWLTRDDKHCGFERDLAQDDEAELLAIPRKARAEVRKGLKNDLEVRVGREKRDLDAHYAVYSESVRNLGTPVFPRKLFKAMIDAFPADSDILTVFKDGVPISSVFSFYHNGAVLPFWGGGIFAARNERSNELMYYKLMLHARSRGMARFDFGRSKAGSGPYNFKKNWGFDPVPLTYGEWTAPGEKPRDIDPTNGAYSRKIELWKKLPLPVANLVGPWIARDLA
ncbi:FemAB family XrtA/PEP-CTERM system-associated protein [Erythrobacter sp. F6033]|uniref:FemAB family XrtA/PEP-CTERM system-associated protein n=1 Tax=Erythrobacter sp. F6033 TaxID=2926401 RepID=UPI001FF1D650|nr:FemAB family XrtA/PEP-CTERM system-associated protein [Erythrobacter sp. F6033]MCK0128252.1 FemAB family PEP-CTERM system-associated protein [Erythrobacter sp. F6033]